MRHETRNQGVEEVQDDRAWTAWRKLARWARVAWIGSDYMRAGKRAESASPRYKHRMLPRDAEGDYEREAMGRYGNGVLWKRMRCNTVDLACHLFSSGALSMFR